MVVKKTKEPNIAMPMINEEFNDEHIIAPLDWADPAPEEILAATHKVKIFVAADSGAVDHCAHPKDLPDSIPVVKSETARNFVGAKGEPIDNYGEAKVNLEQKEGLRSTTPSRSPTFAGPCTRSAALLTTSTT